MDASGYVTLSRQSGLLHQMDGIANNIANASTQGFRREGMVFSEYITRAGEAPSISMGYGNTRVVDLLQGGMTQTRAPFDLAIEGDGFFMIADSAGPAADPLWQLYHRARWHTADRRRISGAGRRRLGYFHSAGRPQCRCRPRRHSLGRWCSAGPDRLVATDRPAEPDPSNPARGFRQTVSSPPQGRPFCRAILRKATSIPCAKLPA